MSTLDSTAIAKTAIRGVSLVILTLLVLRLQTNAQGLRVLPRLFPLALFAFWAIVSTVWSPLKAVSLGHGSEMLMMVLLAISAGYICINEARLKKLLFHLVCISLVLMILLLILNSAAIAAGTRMVDFMQPNMAANIAAAGLLMLVISRLLWKWQWTRILLWPGVSIFVLVEFVAHSRSVIISVTLVGIVVAVILRRSFLFVFLCLAGGLWAASAPHIQSVSQFPSAVSTYMMRGQTSQDAMTLSGRTELWDIGIRSFEESPFYGHGYYVMTDTGFMRVWGRTVWQTAHNSYLHILTGTGLIGFALLSIAFLWILVPLRSASHFGGTQRRAAFLIFSLISYFIVLGCFELSFTGAVDPATITFYLMLGVAAGQVASHEQRAGNRPQVIRS